MRDAGGANVASAAGAGQILTDVADVAGDDRRACVAGEWTVLGTRLEPPLSRERGMQDGGERCQGKDCERNFSEGGRNDGDQHEPEQKGARGT
jgi:hypothetical protein